MDADPTRKSGKRKRLDANCANERQLKTAASWLLNSRQNSLFHLRSSAFICGSTDALSGLPRGSHAPLRGFRVVRVVRGSKIASGPDQRSNGERGETQSLADKSALDV